MGARITVEELLPVVVKTLSSVDLRVACVRISGIWRNVLTAIRISSASPDQTETVVKQLWNDHGPVANDEFRIEYRVLPFSSFEEIEQALRKGKLLFADVEIDYGRPIDLRTSIGNIQSQHAFLLPETGWPTLEISVPTIPVADGANNPQYKIYAEYIQRSVSKRGYSGALEAIATLLGARVGHGNIGSDVCLATPVAAEFTHAETIMPESRITIFGRCHPDLGSGLRVFSRFRSHNGGQTRRIQFKTSPSAEHNTFAATGQFSNADNNEFVDAILVHENIGELSYRSWRLKDLLPEQYVNPLYWLLAKFCSPAQFTSLLARPHFVRPTKTKPQKEFEQHVAWLLGCYGFSTVILGAHEDLKAEETRLKRASLDLLAYHPIRKLMIFGGCTLNVPKEEDCVQLLSVRSMLLEDWEGDLPFTQEAVMFCGAPGCPRKWVPADSDDLTALLFGQRVAVIDADRLSEASEFLQNRNEEQFFSNFEGLHATNRAV